AAAVGPTAETAVAERRLVSVLFADLVGFTTLSASRDAEEVRELLSRYFDTCRRLVVRYGGVVEKFIGDAVMAVWGTPVANEDDAERAVRTALDLVAAASGLADELGVPDLRLRGAGPRAGPGAAVRRPRARVPARQGSLPRLGRGRARATRLDSRSGRGRQVAPLMGVREVRRRAGARRVLAPRPLPRLRRRRRLL